MKNALLLNICILLTLPVSACSGQDGPGQELPAPDFPGSEPEEVFYPKKEGTIRLVTYNIGAVSKSASSSCRLLSDMMTEMAADIVSFNEVDKDTERSGRADQLKQIAEGIGDWKYEFAKAIDFQGGEYGNGIAFNPETVGDVISRISIPFPEAAEPRVCLVLEFKDFVFASTHLDVSSQDERVSEVTEITERLTAEFAGKGKPVFLAGDMNEFPTDPAMMKLKENWSMISADSPTYPSDSPAKCIDMIFVLNGSGEYETAGSRVGLKFNSGNAAVASDHLPVFADIVF